MLGDPISESDHRAVVTGPAVTACTAAIRFVGHPRGAVERGPAIPVAGVVKIEDVANVVVPAIAVESSAVRTSVDLGPANDLLCRQARIDRQHRRRHEKLGRLTVMVDEDLGTPLVIGSDDRLRFALSDSEHIAVEVDLIVVVVRAHAPGRFVFQSGVRRVTLAERVVPFDVSLVAFRVQGRSDDGDYVLQNRLRHRVFAGGELVGDLYSRLERRRLVAVVGVVHPADRRCRARDLRRLLSAYGPRVAQAGDGRTNLFQAGDVLRRADDDK